jgi:hypothetical protein
MSSVEYHRRGLALISLSVTDSDGQDIGYCRRRDYLLRIKPKFFAQHRANTLTLLVAGQDLLPNIGASGFLKRGLSKLPPKLVNRRHGCKPTITGSLSPEFDSSTTSRNPSRDCLQTHRFPVVSARQQPCGLRNGNEFHAFIGKPNGALGKSLASFIKARC